MSKPVAAVGVFVLLLGVLLAVAPDHFLAATEWGSRGGLYLAAAIRIILGLLLIVGARTSRYPMGLKALGALVLLAGIVLLFVPVGLWMGLIGWLTGWSTAVLRVGGVVGTFLGLFLVSAARPDLRAVEK